MRGNGAISWESPEKASGELSLRQTIKIANTFKWGQNKDL